MDKKLERTGVIVALLALGVAAIGIISTSGYDEATKYFFITLVLFLLLIIYIEGIKEYTIKTAWKPPPLGR